MRVIECSEDLLEENAQKLKVCGHPMRLKILCLIERDSACVTELWQCVGQAQPVVSQHLAVLREKGIVDSRVEGNKRLYFITDEAIRGVVRLMLEQRLCESSPSVC